MAVTGMERGQLTRNPHPMLMPRPNHGTMVDMDGHTMAVTGMERGQLTQNPHPMLMPRPNHGTDGDMVGHTMVVTGTERGQQMPNLHPMLMPIPNHPQMLMPTMEDTDGHTMVATTATERGLLT